MRFQTSQFKIGTLLNWAATGHVQLPDYQRDHKWDDERIRPLDSIGTGQNEAEVARI